MHRQAMALAKEKAEELAKELAKELVMSQDGNTKDHCWGLGSLVASSNLIPHNHLGRRQQNRNLTWWKRYTDQTQMQMWKALPRLHHA